MEKTIVLDSLKALINIESLVSSLAGAFFGALFAYLFNIRYQNKKEKDKQLAFLTYAISTMSGVVGKLYIAKKNFVVPRNEEAKRIMNDIAAQKKDNTGQINIQMKALSMFMQTNKFILPFKIEQINFLAGKEPNAAYLICTLNASLDVLNQIVYDYNTYLFQIVQTGKQPDINLLFHFVKNLSDQVDEALYLAEKMQEVLMLYCRICFKKKFKIKSVDIKDEYKHLKPVKISSWEEAVFFPKKKDILFEMKDRFLKKDKS